MSRLAFALAVVVLAAPALAQTPDPAFLQKAVTVLQQQRDRAMNEAAQAQAQVMMVGEELAKAKAELDQLRKPVPAPAAPGN